MNDYSLSRDRPHTGTVTNFCWVSSLLSNHNCMWRLYVQYSTLCGALQDKGMWFLPQRELPGQLGSQPLMAIILLQAFVILYLNYCCHLHPFAFPLFLICPYYGPSPCWCHINFLKTLVLWCQPTARVQNSQFLAVIPNSASDPLFQPFWPIQSHMLSLTCQCS